MGLCNCPTCTARRERERKAELAMIDAMIEMAVIDFTLDLILGPPTPEEIDQAITEANKGRRFTVTGGTDRDQSYVGDIFEVVRVTGNIITARGIVSRDGKTTGWYGLNKLVSINTDRHKTRPVSAEHVRTLRGY